ALAFDSTGNICVVGTVHNGETFDIATVCYDTAGHRRWTALYAGSGTSIDTSIGLAADQSGNVFVAGTSFGGGESAFVTYKYAQVNFTGTPRISTPPRDQLVPLGESAQF